jgi:nitrate/nitrite transporter NarK
VETYFCLLYLGCSGNFLMINFILLVYSQEQFSYTAADDGSLALSRVHSFSNVECDPFMVKGSLRSVV